MNQRCIPQSKSAHESGLSLVELLVALTIGLILVTGLISVFSGNRQNADMNAALFMMKQNARFALDQMSRDARIAGHQGCADLMTSKASVLATDAPTTDFFTTAAYGSIVVSDNNWQPAPPPTFNYPTTFKAVPGTHALIFQYASPTTHYLVNDMVSPAVSLQVTDADEPLNVDDGSLLIISDCNAADIFRATDVSPLVGGVRTITHAASDNSDSANLSKPYTGLDSLSPLEPNPNTAQVYEFNSNIYYIGDTGIRTEDNLPVTALYQQSLPYTNPPTELIQGVENMRVRFGVRTLGGTLRYVTPVDPDFDAGRVESVQIGLLMSSWDEIAPQADEKTYRLAGQAIPAGNLKLVGTEHYTDNRFRLAFNTTIQVRNRRPKVSP